MTRRKKLAVALCSVVLAAIAVTAVYLLFYASSTYAPANLAGRVKLQIVYPYDPFYGNSRLGGYGLGGAGDSPNTIQETLTWKGFILDKPGKVEAVLDINGFIVDPQHPLKAGDDCGRLRVNGENYGVLKMGDAVTVDMLRSGKVTVNGQERQSLKN